MITEEKAASRYRAKTGCLGLPIVAVGIDSAIYCSGLTEDVSVTVPRPSNSDYHLLTYLPR